MDNAHAPTSASVPIAWDRLIEMRVQTLELRQGAARSHVNKFDPFNDFYIDLLDLFEITNDRPNLVCSHAILHQTSG